MPALAQDWWSSGYRIPDGSTNWQDTDPNDFNKTLNEKNARASHLLKPAIRLVKFWNANGGDIYDSFGLEKYMASLGFWGVNNLREYVFSAIDGMALGSGQPQWRKDKLARAKIIVASVRALENKGSSSLAETEVKKLIAAT